MRGTGGAATRHGSFASGFGGDGGYLSERAPGACANLLEIDVPRRPAEALQRPVFVWRIPP